MGSSLAIHIPGLGWPYPWAEPCLDLMRSDLPLAFAFAFAFTALGACRSAEARDGAPNVSSDAGSQA